MTNLQLIYDTLNKPKIKELEKQSQFKPRKADHNVKFNDFTEFLKKDNIPKDITERLNKFLANIKKPQNIFNTFKKLK